MEGITVTYIYKEEASGFDYKGYCENLIEKVKIIQPCEERKWNLEITIFERPQTALKTGLGNVDIGEEERFAFLQDANNDKCPIIIDTKGAKECIFGDENFPLISSKTPFSRGAYNLLIKGYEIDYDDYTIRIGYINSAGVPYRNILQVVYRPFVFRKYEASKPDNRTDWFIDLLSFFFENSLIDDIKSQNSQIEETHPYGLQEYFTQKYIYTQIYIRIRDKFIKETKL